MAAKAGACCGSQTKQVITGTGIRSMTFENCLLTATTVAAYMLSDGCHCDRRVHESEVRLGRRQVGELYSHDNLKPAADTFKRFRDSLID